MLAIVIHGTRFWILCTFFNAKQKNTRQYKYIQTDIQLGSSLKKNYGWKANEWEIMPESVFPNLIAWEADKKWAEEVKRKHVSICKVHKIFVSHRMKSRLYYNLNHLNMILILWFQMTGSNKRLNAYYDNDFYYISLSLPLPMIKIFMQTLNQKQTPKIKTNAQYVTWIFLPQITEEFIKIMKKMMFCRSPSRIIV